MFQSYALWPHMTVRKNIGYPLKARKLKGPATKNWVEETAALVDCSTLLDRYPAQLSGGQQQRVALARGLVARPDVVLFDEPLSNLDARLRDQVRAQLHELHARLGFSAVFVTHDQSEALALADRVAIMRAGRFEQIGTPEHVFEEPATEYVAEFIGMSNRLPLDARATADWAFDGSGRHRRAPRCRATRRRSPRGSDPTTCSWRRPAPTARPAAMSLRGQRRRLAVRRPPHGRRRPGAATPRLDARVPSGAFGGWARKLELDQAVVVGFDPASAVYYGDGRHPARRPRRSGRPRRRSESDAVAIALDAPAARGPRSPSPAWVTRAAAPARRARLPRRHRLPRADAAVPAAAARLRERRRRLPHRLRPAGHRRHDQGDDRPGARVARHRPGARHRCSRGRRPACHRA